MKSILFLAHDPGGFDVISALVEQISGELHPFDFYCAGPAELMRSGNEVDDQIILERIEEGLKSGRYSTLVTGTSWGSKLELQVTLKFKSLGLLTFTVLDYWSHYSRRFEIKPQEFVYPDFFIVMDQIARNEAINEGVPQEIVHILGHPGLDKLIRNGSTLNRLVKQDEAKIHLNLLFLSQPISSAHGRELGFTEEDAINDIIILLHDDPQMKLHIKFHPKDSEIVKSKYVEYETVGKLTDLVASYDLVIGMSTMGLLHSILLGVPVLSYQPNLQTPDDCITNKLGITENLTSIDQLKEKIQAFKKAAILPQMDQLKKNFIWFDGYSSVRIVDFILGVMRLK